MASLPSTVAAKPLALGGLGIWSTMQFRIWSLPMLCSAGAHNTGKEAQFADGLVETIDNVLHRKCALVEKLFHQSVVAFGHHFHQGFVRLFGGFGQIAAGMSPSLPLPSPSGE